MPEFKKVELKEKLRIANGITRKPDGRELLYDVFPTGAPFSFEALDKFSALCYTEIGILHKSFPRHFKNQESQTMKQRFRKLLSLAAAGVLAAALFVTPAAAADAVENGNEAFDRWAAEAAIAERQRMEQLTGLPEDPQAAFEEAAAILEAIENARVMTPITDNEPALIDRDGEPLENETPEKLWAEFVAQFGGGNELSDEEEFPYELRFFTVAGEERFAIYDTRSGRAAAGWQGSTGKWWYSYGDGTWASGWTTINGLTPTTLIPTTTTTWFTVGSRRATNTLWERPDKWTAGRCTPSAGSTTRKTAERMRSRFGITLRKTERWLTAGWSIRGSAITWASPESRKQELCMIRAG